MTASPTRANLWSGDVVRQARAYMAPRLPAPCGRCGETVTREDRWVVGHIKSRHAYPELALVPSNWRVEHRACSDGTAGEAIAEKALREAGFFPTPTPQAGALPRSLSLAKIEPWSVPVRLSWAHHVQMAPAWLRPYLGDWPDGSPPLAMTEVHPLAVCSYGAASCTHNWRGVPFVVEPPAVEWVRQRRGIRLRSWQQLAAVRQLEHDAAGRLCWRTVVESGTRRIGKSERLRSLALWRMEYGGALFEDRQTVVHIGKDLGVVREVQDRAAEWCKAQGWAVSRNNNDRSITHLNGARWLAKVQDGSYGFDVHLGLADECWDVKPLAISEGIEPATMERESSQLVLTSTSHRLATSLMKNRIAGALAADDGRTLLLLWGALPDADPFDEATWRAASAYWTEDRRATIAAAIKEAVETGPEPDNPDPVGAVLAQYLNIWDLHGRRRNQSGEEAVEELAWRELVAEVPESVPDAVAVEGWFNEGVSVARAWRLGDGRVVVSVADYGTLDEASDAAGRTGCRAPVLVGASLLEDPCWVKNHVRTKAAAGTTAAVTVELGRLLAEDSVRHDAGGHLSGQVLALRTTRSADGIRMASSERADAVKAAVWAVAAVRRKRPGGMRLILPRDD